MVLDNLKKVYMTTQFRGKTFFAPQIGEMDQKWPKIGFFELTEKFGH